MPVKAFLKNTKIVSTFGPAITYDLNLQDTDNSSPELQQKVFNLIKEVFLAGVNCVRFNFSHGVLDENNTRIEMIRRFHKSILDSQRSDRRYLKAFSFMADTKGPEIRVFDMGSKDGITYEKDSELIIDCLKKESGHHKGFSVVDATGSYNMANDCVVGNYVLVEDGKLKLKILDVNKEEGKVKVKVMNRHTIKTNKRINLPGATYTMHFVSEKDINDIKYAIDNGFEFLALSFVNSEENIMEVRKLVDNYCREQKIPNIFRIYSKTETTQSCQNLDEIIDASDGIMIARGDLGLEVPYYEVPYWTKQMIMKCGISSKPVITATQMLDSLERNVVATRAEVSDVYRAAELCSDCTMLSGETAQGQFPVLAVETMCNIVFESEKHVSYQKFLSNFYSSVFHSLSEDVKTKVNEVREMMIQNPHTRMILVKGKNISIHFLKALSAMRTACPIFAFQQVDDIGVFLDHPQWRSADYMKMKEMSELTLYRGIHLIFVDGKTDEADCSTMFRESFNIYVDDCCPECCMENVICINTDDNSVKFVR